uniref:Uncharacterized protein n=2 Tax=Podospora anserina (strain S / ATCC MYA-4624 / DSM 980 / FGSC 10383) TaxID=515849 RepID=A0A090CVH2_PODAN|nr:Putative protein of unknown function [Podospora anserina S mat+]
MRLRIRPAVDTRIDRLRNKHSAFLLPETHRYIKAFEEKTEAINSLEAKAVRRTEDRAKVACGSLEVVVHSLLLIERGDKTLSRQSSTIVETLDSTAAKFSNLSQVSEEHMWELGVEAGDCMELKDSVGCFLDNLEAKISELNSFVPHVFDQKARQDRLVDERRSREKALADHYRNAQNALGNVGNVIANFFDRAVMRNARHRLKLAHTALADNRREQERAQSMSRAYYQLAMTVRNLSAAIYSLQITLEKLKQDIGEKYSYVTDKQSAETRLCRGLLDLRNQIVSGDWTTTRDHSLQVVLKLLTAGDAVFIPRRHYEQVQARIRDSITAKLGNGAVQKLIENVPMHVDGSDAALEY